MWLIKEAECRYDLSEGGVARLRSEVIQNGDHDNVVAKTLFKFIL